MLNERESLILTYIIQSFIETGEPVGSRTIEKNYDIGLSSATIRNVMSDLEDLGFLQKTHTSSGRRPSQKALQTYVNRIIKREEVHHIKPIGALMNSFTSDITGVNSLLLKAGQLLAKMSDYATLTFIPKDEDIRVRKVFLKQVDIDKFLFVMMISNDSVYTNIIYDENGLTNIDITHINNFLESEFEDKPIDYFLENLEGKFYSNFFENRKLINHILNLLKEKEEEKEELKIEGLAKLLDHPDFLDIEKMKAVTTIMKDKSLILEKLKNDNKTGIQVFIGSDDVNENLNNLTLIKSSYKTSDNRSATIGILAPIRINYVETINTILDIDRSLRMLLNDYNKEG